MDSVRFTIAIPAYKAKFLAETIESCLLQNYHNFELLIVDDCSPENLGVIIDRFKDARIRYFRNACNFGAVNVVDNWNKCLDYAKGEFIICIGDDDKLLPDCLALYDNLIEKYPLLNVYHTWTQIIDEDSNVIEVQESRPEWESAWAYQYYRWACRWRQYVGDFCFRTEPLRNAGGFYKLPLAWGSDDVTVFRAAKDKGIANTQQFGFQYRKSPITITNSGNQKIKAMAHLQEWRWFEADLNAAVCENSDDVLFKILLLTLINKHYSSKIKDMIEEDLNLSIQNIIYWLKHSCEYGLRKRDICSLYIHIMRKYKRVHF